MSQAENTLVADITVSHGFFVDEVANAIGAGQPGWCEYCSITSYKLSEGNQSAANESAETAAT